MSEPGTTRTQYAEASGTGDAVPSPNEDWAKLDALLEDLPQGIPILPREDAVNFEKYTNRPARVYAEGDGWKNCARALEKYDTELCKGYREEIDTLLVFAGLFSAVVTAFTIESYQWLRSDTDDAILLLLSQIAQSAARNGSDAPRRPASTGLPDPVSVRINIYWFLALSLSLCAALVAILCKQWIREFERNTGLFPRHFVGIHQTKLEGLERWKVGSIISLLPLLLQLALAAFALGVLELLFQLHSAVATVVCVPAGIALVFYAATTVLPVLQYRVIGRMGRMSLLQRLSDCPYKSPQAMLAFRAYDLYVGILHALNSVARYLLYLLSVTRCRFAARSVPWRDVPLPEPGERSDRLAWGVHSWHHVSNVVNDCLDYVGSEGAIFRPTSHYRSLRWIDRNLNDGDITEWIWRCLWEAVVARDPFYPWGAEPLKRNIYHVDCGSTDVPPVGLRAVGLGYLAEAHVPQMFVVEAFVQTLGSMDPLSAQYLAQQMTRRLGLLLDSEVVASILRVATTYARAHAREAIGGFIVAVSELLIDRSEDQLCDQIYDHTLLLYLGWLRGQPAPYDSAVVAATNRAALIHCNALMDDRLGYGEHPERVRARPYVLELAELLRTYAGMLDPLVWQAHDARECALVVGIYGYHREEVCPAVRVLLDIALAGDEPSRVRVGDAAASPHASIQAAESAPDPSLAARAYLSAALCAGPLSQSGSPVAGASAESSAVRRAAPLARGHDVSADRADPGPHDSDERDTAGSARVRGPTTPAVPADDEGVDGRTRTNDS